MCENNEKKKLDIEGLEGLRGDGEAKWYVVHTYSGHENKVKVNIEKIVENRVMHFFFIYFLFASFLVFVFILV